MVSARTARLIATTAAYGGSGVGLLGAGLYGLLRAEAWLARRAIGSPATVAPVADGGFGRQAGQPLSLVILGDSSAAGVGVEFPGETPGALLAAGIADAAERPVRLTVLAVTGARSTDLAGQVERALTAPPDLAVIMIGANDVTHRVKPVTSVRLLGDAVHTFRTAGSAVVVLTCPDLGTVEPIPHPLRWLVRRASRRLAAAQTVVAVEAGARTVSIASMLGPEFAPAAGMFSPDRFHPSAAGYAAAAAAVLPTALSALGVGADEHLEVAQGDDILPVAVAAAVAAEASGTEVAPRVAAGSDRGARSLWVLLRHRRRRPLPERQLDADVARSR
ncbi:MAG: SGNH/GDSL hydrolase family protein [Jiangellaceae bacterium]|nr:SGNH/GDSL hydrolase family protein [Jiangellaceae bacterium]